MSESKIWFTCDECGAEKFAYNFFTNKKHARCGGTYRLDDGQEDSL